MNDPTDHLPDELHPKYSPADGEFLGRIFQAIAASKEAPKTLPGC